MKRFRVLAAEQYGLSMIGFLLVCVLVGFGALTIMRLLPLYIESFKVSSALDKVAAMPDIADKTPYEIRTAILKQFEVDDVDRFDNGSLRNHLSVKGNREKGSRVMSMNYEHRGVLFGNLDVVLKFDQSRTIAGAASE